MFSRDVFKLTPDNGPVDIHHTAYLTICCLAIGLLSSGCQSESSPAAQSGSTTAQSGSAASTAVANAAASIDQPLSQELLDKNEIQRFAFTVFNTGCVRQLQKEDFQKSLSLTADQVAVFQPLEESAHELQQMFKTLAPATRAKIIEEDFLPTAQYFHQTINQTLNDDQQDQLFKGVLQQQSRLAISYILPGVPEALEMTEEQQRKIEAIIEENLRIVDIRNVPLLQMPGLFRRAATSRSTARGYLTEDQIAKYDELLGDG